MKKVLLILMSCLLLATSLTGCETPAEKKRRKAIEYAEKEIKQNQDLIDSIHENSRAIEYYNGIIRDYESKH